MHLKAGTQLIIVNYKSRGLIWVDFLIWVDLLVLSTGLLSIHRQVQWLNKPTLVGLGLPYARLEFFDFVVFAKGTVQSCQTYFLDFR
jgi:hypothetical protein